MGNTRDLFKKIRDTKGTFHAKMDTIKDRKGLDLTEAEDIKKRWQEYTEEELKLLSWVWLFATPWTVSYQAPTSMGFSRQEYWSGLPLPSPEELYKKDLHDPDNHNGVITHLEPDILEC